MASKRTYEGSDLISSDDARNSLFDRILGNLADADEFGRSSSSSIFIVYAHDIKGDDQGDAHASVVGRLIEWLGRIRSRTLSDKAPLPLWQTRESGEDAARNILSNQFCLLPANHSSPQEDIIGSVDKVVVCGSRVLQRYYQDDFTASYTQRIETAYHASLKATEYRELLQASIRQVVDANCSNPGFHHVLTELAFLQLRSWQSINHGIVPVSLDGDLMTYLPHKDGCDLVIKLKSFQRQDEHLVFFTLLKQLFPGENDLIKTWEDCYGNTAQLLLEESNITSDRAFECISHEIRKTHMDLEETGKAAYRTMRADYQLQPGEWSAFNIALSILTVDEIAAANRLANEPRISKFLSALPTVACSDRKDRNPRRVEGTCEWFKDHQLFREWQNANVSRLLWVSADPGCGKSVLVRHLVDDVFQQSAATTTISYFFFKDDFQDQCTVESALRCLLHQIFTQQAHLITHDILKANETDGTYFESFVNLWSTLITVASARNAGEIICVLDALDECEENGKLRLIHALNDLYAEGNNHFNLKFLVTSRPYPDIQREFRVLEDLHPTIHLSGNGVAEAQRIASEINLVIEAKSKELGTKLRLDDSQTEIIRSELSRNANRTYLWVYLVFDELRQMIKMTKINLRNCVRQLPQTVNDAYEKILSKSKNIDDARKLLHIVLAATRPLTVEEMAVTFAIEEDHKSLDEVEPEQDRHFRDTLGALCGLFLTIVDSRIYMLHQTAKEFLSQRRQPNSPVPPRDTEPRLRWQYSFCPIDSNRVLARICIWYLGLEGKPAILRHYAAENLSFHYCAAGDMLSKALHIKAKHLIEDFSLKSSHWLDSVPDVRWNLLQCAEESFAVVIACILGLEGVFRLLLEENTTDLEIRLNRSGLTLLHVAVRYRRITIAQLLIRSHAQIDVQSIMGQTPFHFASSHGELQTVQLLIKSGAEIDVRSNMGQTPLHFASSRGKVQTVQLLIESGAEIDIRDGDGQTPLHFASSHGEYRTVQLLIESGADIDVRDNRGQTPLHLASSEGKSRTVQLLIESGTDIDVRDEDGQTPLHSAISEGKSQAVFQLSIESGTDIDFRDGDDWTPPDPAISEGDAQTVQLLIESGAGIDTQDITGQTPLWHAIEGFTPCMRFYYIYIMKLLLQSGANTEIQDVNGRTLLARWKERFGHDTVAELIERWKPVKKQLP